MGCFWSSQEYEHCRRCNRIAINNLVLIDEICEICINSAVNERPRGVVPVHNVYVKQRITRGPKYGKYRCNSCGRHWTSRLSWPDKYQKCKHCRTPVIPHFTRDLLPSETTKSDDNKQEHAKELCQMCEQLGRSCKAYI